MPSLPSCIVRGIMIQCNRVGQHAHVAELVDAPVLGSGELARGGSSPLVRMMLEISLFDRAMGEMGDSSPQLEATA